MEKVAERMISDMKSQFKTLSATITTCLLAVFIVGTVSAQGEQQASELLRIRKLTDLNKEYRQRASTLGTRSVKPRDWGVFDVTFDTAPEWIDELTVTFTIMLHNDKAKQGEKPMSLMTLTVMYSDIAQGRDRKAGVVISPPALERYGSPIGFSAQIFVAGQLAAEEGVVTGALRKQPEMWWKNPQIVDSPNVQKRDGYMVERSKSVFNLVDIDAYEAGK